MSVVLPPRFRRLGLALLVASGSSALAACNGSGIPSDGSGGFVLPVPASPAPPAAPAPAAPGPLPAGSAQRAYTCVESLVSPAAADAEIAASYAVWKQRYVTEQGAGGGLRVTVGPRMGDHSLSEGIGYGMLLAAYLNDRPTFDGLWRYAKQHLNPRGLMAWKISAAGQPEDRNAATDGDEDIAFALIVADRRWGGYADEARALVQRIRRWEVEEGTLVLKPGDVWGGSSVTNPSYFAPAYYKAFARLTGDASWERVADESYAILDRVWERGGPGIRLLPEWTTAAGDSAAGFLHRYDYGAARIPWRLAMDAAWNCDSRAQAHLARLNAFFAAVGPERVVSGYRLDGTPVGQEHIATFVAPVAAGALVSSDPGFRTAAWRETVRLRDDGYYSDSLRLLSLLLAGGRMPPPFPASP